MSKLPKGTHAAQALLVPEEQFIREAQVAELMVVIALSHLGYYRGDVVGYLTDDQRKELREVCARTIAEVDAYVPPPASAKPERPTKR